MNPKNEDLKQSLKNKTVPKNGKSNLININTNNNNNNIININNKKNSKSNIIPSKDSKQYNVQLTILDESKKLKINLEITEGQKIKRIYITTLTLEELISLNNFFSQFKDYSEAFDFLLKNFTKIDRNKIKYLNNNNDITIILLFALGEEDNELIEESIEITLHRYTGNQMNKSLSNINSVINNLKLSLEKFNISIKELKSNVNKDKIEKDKRINELEQIFKNCNTKHNNKENWENKFDDIYNKIEEQNINIEDIKKTMEENDINQRNEIDNNNKIILEKENELAQLITEKFNDFINRINSYDEKSIEMENNFNDKLTDLDNKTNICFNELIKKINIKNENKIPDNNLKEELNETINYLVEENENLEKRLENKLEEKINNIMMSKIKNLEEKINQLAKNLGEDNNTKNELNNNINILIKEKFDEFEQYKINLLKNIEKNETDINENKIKINDINAKINELFEHVNKNKEINLDEIKNDINNKINDIKENNKNIDEIKNIIKNDLDQEYNNKIEETKKEINTIINNMNEIIKNNSTDLKNKIELFKNDISKNNEEKINKIEEKINKLEKKYSSKESKSNKKQSNNQIFYDTNNNKNINDTNNNNKNYINIDQTIKYMEYKKDVKSKNKEIYSSKTLDNDENKFALKKLRKQSSNKNNILSRTLPELNPSNSDNKTEKDSDSSSKKNIRNSYFISSSNLFSSRLKDRTNVFELFVDSNIFKKEDINDNFFIFTKLKEIYAYNRYIKLNLIYRASRDGDSAKDFHFKCDFIGPNLTVIKTKKEYIFGGFTIKTWKHLFKDINNEDPECGTELKDEQAFGFSVNKNKIYENGKQDEGIIYCNSNYGPCFKNFFFKIFDKCFENGGICGTIKESNFIGIEKDFEINGGEQNFDIEEIEVFQIAFR